MGEKERARERERERERDVRGRKEYETKRKRMTERDREDRNFERVYENECVTYRGRTVVTATQHCVDKKTKSGRCEHSRGILASICQTSSRNADRSERACCVYKRRGDTAPSGRCRVL